MLGVLITVNSVVASRSSQWTQLKNMCTIYMHTHTHHTFKLIFTYACIYVENLFEFTLTLPVPIQEHRFPPNIPLSIIITPVSDGENPAIILYFSD